MAACTGLLRGGEPGLLLALGGPPTQVLLADDLPEGQRYWYRVWAGRALLWCWLDDDPRVLTPAFTDEAWRVRETACKVVAGHLVGDHLDEVQRLTDDPVPRVAASAHRALTRLVAAGA